MKISTKRLQAVLLQGLNAAETEDYVVNDRSLSDVQ